MVLEAVPDQVHLLERQPEVELCLAARSTVRVSRGNTVDDLLCDLQVARELIDLCLEKMLDWLDVCAAVAIFDEETQRMLVPIRGADYPVVALLGMVVQCQ